jgi:hypothetical protein
MLIRFSFLILYVLQDFWLMMTTAVVFGIAFQTWFMCLRIAYITEMSPTKVCPRPALLNLSSHPHMAHAIS